MGNKDPEKDYSNFTDVLKFVFEQLTKNIYVSIPGTIDSYDPATKRAVVHPAINIQKTDDTTILQESIVNVPVIWPSGGGFTIISPLPKGEPVEILFSQRGITKFKETFEDSDPGIGLFDKEDAYIIAGFGALSITPATESGISMQSEDGANYIFIEDSKIKIKSSVLIEAECVNLSANVSGSTTLICPVTNITGNINLTGNLTIVGTLTVNGIVFGLHVHPILGGSSAPGPTGVPA